MTRVNFEERAVAYVDVLGFKTIVAKAVADVAARNQLQSLVDLLSGAVPRLDAIVAPSVSSGLIPRHNYFSDCIILSAPLSDESTPNYSGLEILVMRIIQLTHHFLNEGYLLRGGLSVGQVWHTDTNIVGPAYQEAYLLESGGDDPCVVLSPTAEEVWNARLGSGSRMCIRKAHHKHWFFTRNRTTLIVNGLHDYYIPRNSQLGGVERRYEKYSQIADQRIASPLPKSAKRKWRWFKQYLAAERSEAAKWTTG